MYHVWRKLHWPMKFQWRCTPLLSKDICQSWCTWVPCSAGFLLGPKGNPMSNTIL